MPAIPDGAKIPQDHLSRAEPKGPFTFTVGGTEYQLPDADEANQLKIPAHIVRAAVNDEGLGPVALTFASLEVSGANQETLDALYSLTMDEVGRIYLAWTQHKTSPEAASLGESGSSPS